MRRHHRKNDQWQQFSMKNNVWNKYAPISFLNCILRIIVLEWDWAYKSAELRQTKCLMNKQTTYKTAGEVFWNTETQTPAVGDNLNSCKYGHEGVHTSPRNKTSHPNSSQHNPKPKSRKLKLGQTLLHLLKSTCQLRRPIETENAWEDHQGWSRWGDGG